MSRRTVKSTEAIPALKKLAATLSATQQGPKQIGKPLCWVPDWLFFWLSTSLTPAPPEVTGLFSHWLWNLSRSWVAAAREVCTSSDRPRGSSVLGKTLLPNPFVASYFFQPCLTPACSTRMQRVATGLLHLPSASKWERRNQQKETRCSVSTNH